jgi:hypothetical protein
LFPQLKDHRVDPLDCHGIERLVQKTGHCLKPNLMGSADCGPTIKIVPAPSGTSSLDYGLSVHPGWGRSFRDHLNGQLGEVWLCNEVVMDTAEHCREQLKKVQKALPLAKSDAEATVLKNLARSWKMIANQMALYEQLQAKKKEVRPAPEQT